MRRSFAFRLAAAFAGVGIAAAAVTAILVNLAFGSRFASYLKEQQASRVDQLVVALQDSYRTAGGWDLVDLESLDALALMDGGTVRLEDAAGTAVWSPTSGPVGGPMARMHREMMGGGPLGPEQVIPIRSASVVVGRLFVRLPRAGLLPQDLSFRSSVNRALLLGGIAAGVVALFLGILLARRATAPAVQLTDAARAVAAGDRSYRVPSTGLDEFGQMAVAFNAMADTIEEEDRLRRVFAADVAHELRTPLAILRTQIEGMQDGVVEPASSSLASLHEETLRLTRLVEDLETLASADAAGFSLQPVDVSLGQLLEDAMREFSGPFESAGIEREVHLEAVTVRADPTRIRQLVSDLLSNALKFTPEGGRVRLSMARHGDRAVVTVSDSGSGIPPDELPHVFDRFYRGKGGRARGSGIGLTVAREIVRAHGGTIDVHSAPGAGAEFVIELPGASSGEPRTFTAPSHGPASVRAKGGST